MLKMLDLCCIRTPGVLGRYPFQVSFLMIMESTRKKQTWAKDTTNCSTFIVIHESHIFWGWGRIQNSPFPLGLLLLVSCPIKQFSD